VNVGDVMSNDVQAHEAVAERVSGEDRRGSLRHAARALGSVTARIIGGSQVDLVNFSSRGVLFECDSRLLIGARASVRITTTDANIIVTGRVVRSRVKGLVNGALRYDAALVLDTELGLAPPILEGVPPADDDLVFESAFEDPSPVEAYLAESEASLLEVASGTDLPLHGSLVEAADAGDAVVADDSVACDAEPVAFDAQPVAVDAEPVAFEADADIAFEPSVEFAFDEVADAAGEPAGDPADVLVVERIVIDEPAGSSMFDATYIPPTYEPEASAASAFEVTPPMPAPEQSASSFFDARPSENYGDAAVTPGENAVVTAAAGADLAAEAAEGIDFESEVAFEAVDAVMFEPSFDDMPAEAPVDRLAGVSTEPPAPTLADAPATAAALPTLDAVDAVDAPGIEVAFDDDIEPPAAVPDTEDRVLLQFAATVPHDLAELRRIAADNQW
jgi:hypothetical protein